MFTVIGCLGTIVGQANSTDEAITIVQQQIPLSNKKLRTLGNALQRLAAGSEYHVDYGGSGCTVRRS